MHASYNQFRILTVTRNYVALSVNCLLQFAGTNPEIGPATCEPVTRTCDLKIECTLIYNVACNPCFINTCTHKKVFVTYCHGDFYTLYMLCFTVCSDNVNLINCIYLCQERCCYMNYTNKI